MALKSVPIKWATPLIIFLWEVALPDITWLSFIHVCWLLTHVATDALAVAWCWLLAWLVSPDLMPLASGLTCLLPCP